MDESMVGEAREVNHRGRCACGMADPRRVRERLEESGRPRAPRRRRAAAAELRETLLDDAGAG